MLLAISYYLPVKENSRSTDSIAENLMKLVFQSERIHEKFLNHSNVEHKMYGYNITSHSLDIS